MRRWRAYLAGVAAPLLYVAGVVLGGWTTPGYSQIANTISELTMVGSPNRLLLAAIFILYNLLLTVFALSLARTNFGAGQRTVGVGPTLLVVIAIGELACPRSSRPIGRPTR